MIQVGQVYIDSEKVIYKIKSCGHTWDGTAKLIIDILNPKDLPIKMTVVAEDTLINLIKAGTIKLTGAGTVLFGDDK